MKIAIFGAGGPVAAGAIRELEPQHTLRLTDIAELETPHEFMRVDISRLDDVAAAAAGMDVLINCTVNRRHPAAAFDVNTRGAYNLMRAAVDLGVPRVIHTGPAQIFGARGDYMRLDWRLTEEAPPHVGLELYGLSKYLGWEVIRTFCRHHPEVCVVAFMYCGFMQDEPGGMGWTEFAVHTDDAAQAFRLGVEVPRDTLPSNCELFNISADLPLGKVSVDKARRLLGYEPQHNFRHVWSRRERRAWAAAQAQTQPPAG